VSYVPLGEESAISISGEVKAFFTSIPTWLTSSGSWPLASCWRDWVRIRSMFGSVPSLKSTISAVLELPVEFSEYM
jgi:hypothetical protein